MIVTELLLFSARFPVELKKQTHMCIWHCVWCRWIFNSWFSSSQGWLPSVAARIVRVFIGCSTGRSWLIVMQVFIV